MIAFRRTHRFSIWILPVTAMLCGCSDMGLPEYIKLDRLRVLALIPDAPEVAPGATVTITPVVSDYGANRTLTFSAEACPDPGLTLGRDPSCESSALRVSVGSGNVSFPNGTHATNRTGLTTSLPVVTVPATILTGLPSDVQFNGVFYVVTYTLSASDGSQVKSFLRIRVSNKSPKNNNPVINDILANGSSLANNPINEVSLTLSFSAGSKETWTTQRSDGTFTSQTEVLTTTWFYTAGKMKVFRTLDAEANTFQGSSSAPPSGLNHLLVAVVRDGREGIAASIRIFP